MQGEPLLGTTGVATAKFNYYCHIVLIFESPQTLLSLLRTVKDT